MKDFVEVSSMGLMFVGLGPRSGVGSGQNGDRRSRPGGFVPVPEAVSVRVGDTHVYATFNRFT